MFVRRGSTTTSILERMTQIDVAYSLMEYLIYDCKSLKTCLANE